MLSHDIDQSATSVPVRAPNGRWHALFGGLGVAALVALTLGASVAAAAPPPSAPTGAEGGGSVPSADVEKLDAAFMKYAACMREHGIEMPDPVTIEASGALDATAPTTGVVTVMGTSQALSVDPGSEAFIAADKACAPILEEAGILGAASGVGVPIEGPAGAIDGVGAGGGVFVAGGGDLTELSTSMQAYAACMRTHGIDVPDPVVDEKAGTVRLAFGADPTSVAFREADAACAAGSGMGFGLAVPALTGR